MLSNYKLLLTSAFVSSGCLSCRTIARCRLPSCCIAVVGAAARLPCPVDTALLDLQRRSCTTASLWRDDAICTDCVSTALCFCIRPATSRQAVLKGRSLVYCLSTGLCGTKECLPLPHCLWPCASLTACGGHVCMQQCVCTSCAKPHTHVCASCQSHRCLHCK